MYEMMLDGERVTGDTLAEMSAAWCKARDASLQGASTWPRHRADGAIRNIGFALPFARLSYNGRVWRYGFVGDQHPGALLYDNRS